MGLDDFWMKAIKDLQGPFLVSNTSVMVPISQCEQFIDWLHGSKRILGFEGFVYDGVALKPVEEAIADFSGIADSEPTDGAAKHVLEEVLQSGVQFVEFVFA